MSWLTFERPVRSGGTQLEGRTHALGRIDALDGYRALAIVMVLIFHYTVHWAYPQDPQDHFPTGRMFNDIAILDYGWLGVELFFVISGFVILMTLERSRSIVDFILRRFARLWPPLIVAATLTTVVMAAIGPSDWLVSGYDYLTSILLLDPHSVTSKLLHNPSIKWVDGAYWSLWVEIRFYAIAAVVYWVARKKFINYWIVLISIVLLAYDFLIPTNVGLHKLFSFLFFPIYLPYFTLGICTYEFFSKKRVDIATIVGSSISVAAILYNVCSQTEVFAGKDIWICLTANFVIFALFVLFILDHPLIAVFKLRPVAALGQASYSLYLIHQQIGVAAINELVKFGVPGVVAILLITAGVVGLSFLLFRFVENPAKRWILRNSKAMVGYAEKRAPWVSYGRDAA